MGTYLVTGGAGFIGSHIAEQLCREGNEVRILDNLSSGFRRNFEAFSEAVHFIEGDICDSATVRQAVKGVDVIFHQAALASVPASVAAPLKSHAACVTGTLTVLDEARRADVGRVVFAASSAAYGDSAFSSKREPDLPQPLSPYAAAKIACEMYCQAMHHTYGLETVCLRYFNVFGPRQDPESEYSAVIPIFIAKMLAGERPTVFGDGGQSRDFTYIENVVHANLLAARAKNAAGKVFNIANGKATTLLELLHTLSALLGVDVSPSHEPPRVGDVRESLADISAARAVLGYEPKVDVEDGLRRSIDYYRSLIAAC